MAKEESCGNCRFWVPNEDEEVGEGTCHFNAPKPIMSGQMVDEGIDTVWPWVAAEDWCGQWQGGK